MRKQPPLWKRAIPVSDWPAADQKAWEEAKSEGDPFEETGGLAHGWREQTRRNAERHYARWLAYLRHVERSELKGSPHERVTPEAVKRYGTKIRLTVAPRSLVTSIVGLKEMMRVMAPQQDWRWLEEICNRLDRVSKPLHKNRVNTRPVESIVKAVLKELKALEAAGLCTYTDKRRYRDTFMLALMAMRPLRLKNFAALTIGKTILKNGDRWLVYIPAVETKTNRELGFTVPDLLVPHLERYLRDARPALLRGRVSEALWPGRDGGYLDHRSLYTQFLVVSKRLLGVPLNPHLLRDCAATSLAMHSPASAQMARALLGHRNFATTERYYIQANNIEASRKVNALIELLPLKTA